MAKILNEKITDIELLAPDIFKMTLKSEYVAGCALPGQFVNIKCCEGANVLLRRPISICSVDDRNKTFDVVFQIKGVGTELLSKKKAGEKIDFIGPLGNTFDRDSKYRRIAVIGGGIGIFPLFFLLNQSKASVKNTYLGFRNTDCIVMKDEFRNTSSNLNISTDDGSFGFKGLVTDILERDLENTMPDIIYACGPKPMIRTVAGLADRHGIPCQVSMEERMGCGIGACLVCACKTKSKEDIPQRSGSKGEACALTVNDGWKYSHVCKDGPVFWSSELIFD